MSFLKAEIMKLLNDAFNQLDEFTVSDQDILNSITIPPNQKFGDYSSNIGFRFDKQLKTSPGEIAKLIVKHIPPSSLVEKTLAMGGFVNFFVTPKEITQLVLIKIFQEKNTYGHNTTGQQRKLVLEHTAVNPSKPLHIGHLRNAVLGDLMARIYRACGYNVEVQNLINDAGKQVATVVWAIHKGLHVPIIRQPQMKFDFWLGLVYTRAAEALKLQPELEQEIDTLMVEITENSDFYASIRSLTEKCVEYNLETTWRAGITYDLLIWESDISRSGLFETTLKTLENNEHFSWVDEGEYSGCFMAHLTHLPEFAGERSADKVLVRSNGIPTYTANDLALQMWKFGLMDQIQLKYRLWTTQFDDRMMWSSTPFQGPSNVEGKPNPPEFAHAERVVNVIGSEQEYPQSILRVVLKLTGHLSMSENSIHLSYKHVTLPGERISGREDEWIKTRAWADAVIDDAVTRAYEYIVDKRSELTESHKKGIAEKIGIATVRYWLLKFSTEKNIVFEINRASSLEGDTGPYVLYSFVRATKLLAKVKERGYTLKNPTEIALPEMGEEVELIKTLAKLPEVIQSVSESIKPNLLTTYAYELATNFNSFYERFPVLSAESDEILLLRATIVAAYQQVLQNVLHLLGIPPIDEM